MARTLLECINAIADAMRDAEAVSTPAEWLRLNEKLETVDPNFHEVSMAFVRLSNDMTDESDREDGIKPFDAVREHGTLVAVGGRVS